MNFFGHAVLASERGGPRFVVGAMLPDLVTMLARGGRRVRVPTAHDREIAAGVTFHYATDEAFHDAPLFHAASSEALTELTAAGVDRGPARAIAHIGVELLLDWALARRTSRRAAYRAALADQAAFAPPILEWAPATDAAAMERLRQALFDRDAELHDGPPTVIAERLQRILAPRPRLAFPPAQLPLVTEWVDRSAPKIAAFSEALLDETRARLRVEDPA